ncbi:single-stranded DNA-binding protein [Xanthomonas translucens pv. translucens]|uniref:Single-stranded DNA-binding protein n=2 Tax=Xanthomonas campestris pv. translucens TaxID=343 RepID=A0A125PV58_XANCT|nr:single-stranded DNA-binding protein [Xanthomonas translucens]KWV12212.1 single-stranded DNA-binding protein [Xanthomonas translucens]QSQ35248.1 single-stranded DNA-binding protein [Xanthomonas translucens pv. translucens]QSQ44060.1 single-stranded DNA-binding protein [Xanthomonas translucens pv. translucens]UII62132.1 G5P family DNA-binding protein [Xanthomonas translucens]
MSGIKVTVMDAEVIERGGTFKDDSGQDRSYTTRKQKAKIEMAGFAYPFDVRLEDGQKGYPVGEYELDIEAMGQVNKGVLSLSKFTKLRGKNVARAAA